MEKNLPAEIRIVKGDDGEPWADSREVAKRLERAHRHILQSLRDMDCSDKFYRRNFRLFKIKDLTKESGESTSHVMMTERGFVALCRSLKGGVATEIFEAFVEEFYRMRMELAKRQEPAILTRMEILQLAMDSEKRALEAEAQVGELKPDAESMRMLRSGEGHHTMTAVAKMLDVKRNWLFGLLTQCGWFYKQNGVSLPYAPLMKQGLLTVDPAKGKPIMRSSGAIEVKVTTLVTAKGLAKITEIVKQALEKQAKAEIEDEEIILNRLRHDDAVYGNGDD